jgi:hypothetical protein
MTNTDPYLKIFVLIRDKKELKRAIQLYADTVFLTEDDEVIDVIDDGDDVINIPEGVRLEEVYDDDDDVDGGDGDVSGRLYSFSYYNYIFDVKKVWLDAFTKKYCYVWKSYMDIFNVSR